MTIELLYTWITNICKQHTNLANEKNENAQRPNKIINDRKYGFAPGSFTIPTKGNLHVDAGACIFYKMFYKMMWIWLYVVFVVIVAVLCNINKCKWNVLQSK